MVFSLIMIICVSLNTNQGDIYISAHWLEYLPMAWETRVPSQVDSYQKLQKWYLMPPCLTFSIIRCWSRVSGAMQGMELHLSLHLDVVVIEKGPSGLTNFLIYIYCVLQFLKQND